MSTATVIIGLFSDRQCRPFLKLKAECCHFARRCSGSPRFSAEPLRGKPPNGQYRNSVLRKFLGLSTRTPLWIRHVYLGRCFLVYMMTCNCPGVTEPTFPRTVIFKIVQNCQVTWDVIFLFDRCRRSLTPDKYERGSRDLTWTLAKSPVDPLTNGQ